MEAAISDKSSTGFIEKVKPARSFGVSRAQCVSSIFLGVDPPRSESMRYGNDAKKGLFRMARSKYEH